MSKWLHKINQAQACDRGDMIQNNEPLNKIISSDEKNKSKLKPENKFASGATDVPVFIHSSSTSIVGEASGKEELKIRSDKRIVTEYVPNLFSNPGVRGTEKKNISMNNDAQLKFECDDMGVEIIELDSIQQISSDQVNDLIGSFCDNEEQEIYSDSTAPLEKTGEEEIDNEMLSDDYDTERVVLDESENHVLDVHATGKKKFECTRCRKRFSYEGYLIKHKCDTTTDARGLKVEIQDNDVPRHKCRVCNQTFESKYYLKKHARSEGHQSNIYIEKPYRCQECFRSYVKLSYLRTHKCRLHMCEICGTSFMNVEQLEKHAVVHEVERLYSCTKCKKVYTSLPGLRYHEKNHTGERRHVCSTCGKCFALSSTLKIHQTCHSEQRPFPCLHPTCGKSFSVLGHLRTHELRHTGLRPHGCPHCEKHFTDVANLKKHLKLHAVERPLFVCSVCQKQYISLRGLRDHESQHSGESFVHFKTN